jgi:hypothetical protein
MHLHFLARSLLAGLELSLAGFGIAVGLSSGLECGGCCVNTFSLLGALKKFLHLGIGSLLAKDGTESLVVEVDGQANQEGILNGGSLDLVDLSCILASDGVRIKGYTYI